MTVRMWPMMTEEESVRLLYAAGLKDFEKRPVNLKSFTDKGLEVPEIFRHLDKKYRRTKGKASANIIPVPRLLEACRDVVRDHLIEHNARNLFQVVPELEIPRNLKTYLLYEASVPVQ